MPISYGKLYAQRGGNMIYVLDRAAGEKVLQNATAIRQQGIDIEELTGA